MINILNTVATPLASGRVVMPTAHPCGETSVGASVEARRVRGGVSPITSTYVQAFLKGALGVRAWSPPV